MRKLFWMHIGIAAMAVVSVCTIANTASATVVLGDKVKLTNPLFPVGAGSNGEFSVDVKAGGIYDGVTDFRTFCVEKDQTFSIGAEMDVTKLTLSTSGPPPGAGPYTMTATVAWLFREFTKDRLNLAGQTESFYDETSSALMNADANSLQNAFWHYTGGQVAVGTISAKYTALIAANAGAIGLLVADAVSIGGVSIMQLKTGGSWSGGGAGLGDYIGGINRQDQLVVDLSGLSTDVPEPASMLLWLTVAIGGAFARGRKRLPC